MFFGVCLKYYPVIYFSTINFILTVVLDYKDFCLLLPKKENITFALGGKGFGEFCMFCHALRVSMQFLSVIIKNVLKIAFLAVNDH